MPQASGPINTEGSLARFFRLILGALILMAMPPMPSQANATMPSAVYKIGTPAAAGNIAVTLLSVDAQSGASSEGDLEIAIAYAIRNISKKALPGTALPEFHLEDKNGATYDAAGQNGTAPLLDEIAPGAAITRHAFFHVPKGDFNPKTWLFRVGGPQGPRITLQ